MRQKVMEHNPLVVPAHEPLRLHKALWCRPVPVGERVEDGVVETQK
jgi:hypothetical protein